jgi:hypothetical protein
MKAKRPNGHEMLSIFPSPAGMSLTKLSLNDSLADFFFTVYLPRETGRL